VTGAGRPEAGGSSESKAGVKFGRTEVAAVLLGFALLASIGFLKRERFLGGVNDFVQLYAGARLVGSPELYRSEASRAIHREVLGVELQAVYYSRPPFYAWLLRPLTRLTYLQAYSTFLALNILAVAWFWLRFARRDATLAVFTSLFPPLIVALLNGQDICLVLGLASAAYLQLERKRDFSAGLLLSLCSIKAHLFLLVPVVLLLRRRWAALAGGVSGGVVLTLLSFHAAGPDWIRDYLRQLGNPELHPSFDLMPNLQAVRLALGTGEWLLPAGGLLVAGLVAAAAWRSPDWRIPFAGAIGGSLAISYHAYVHDALPLLLGFAIVLQASRSRLLRSVWALAVCFLPSVMLLLGTPWSAVLPLLLTLAVGVPAVERAQPPAAAAVSPARVPD
jgi:hypothetical protein